MNDDMNAHVKLKGTVTKNHQNASTGPFKYLFAYPYMIAS